MGMVFIKMWRNINNNTVNEYDTIFTQIFLQWNQHWVWVPNLRVPNGEKQWLNNFRGLCLIPGLLPHEKRGKVSWWYHFFTISALLIRFLDLALKMFNKLFGRKPSWSPSSKQQLEWMSRSRNQIRMEFEKLKQNLDLLSLLSLI